MLLIQVGDSSLMLEGWSVYYGCKMTEVFSKACTAQFKQFLLPSLQELKPHRIPKKMYTQSHPQG